MRTIDHEQDAICNSRYGCSRDADRTEVNSVSSAASVGRGGEQARPSWQATVVRGFFQRMAEATGIFLGSLAAALVAGCSFNESPPEPDFGSIRQAIVTGDVGPESDPALSRNIARVVKRDIAQQIEALGTATALNAEYFLTAAHNVAEPSATQGTPLFVPLKPASRVLLVMSQSLPQEEDFFEFEGSRALFVHPRWGRLQRQSKL